MGPVDGSCINSTPLGLWPGCFTKRSCTLLTPLDFASVDAVAGVGLRERNDADQLVPPNRPLLGEPHEVAYEGELLIAGPLLLWRSFSLPWSAVGQLERRSVVLLRKGYATSRPPLTARTGRSTKAAGKRGEAQMSVEGHPLDFFGRYKNLPGPRFLHNLPTATITRSRQGGQLLHGLL
jgi:hypothetical protein